MPITFNNYKDAIEYVARKNDEGYEASMCGGRQSKGDSPVYIVTVKRRKTLSKSLNRETRWTPYMEINRLDSNNVILNKLKKAGKPPLRSAEYIENMALRKLQKAGIRTVGVRVGQLYNRDKYSDAEVQMRETKEGKEIPIMVKIHPIHQYTNRQHLDQAIEHEIEHIKEDIK